MKTQNMADKFHSAFNGRYFRDDVIDLGARQSPVKENDEDIANIQSSAAYQNEIIHSVYLSDFVKVDNLESFDLNNEY